MLGWTSGQMMRGRCATFGTVAFLLVLAMTSCEQPRTAQDTHPVSVPSSPPELSPDLESSHRYDLAADEAIGGHTLARHIGKTDDELRERLRREPDISSASTYSDQATAEAVVGAALATSSRSFDAWRRRTGRRPNFVLHFASDHVIGRSMTRGRLGATPCRDALVVLRWDDRREQFYVLTSYPEERR
jgi:CDI toxin RNase A-like protein